MADTAPKKPTRARAKATPKKVGPKTNPEPLPAIPPTEEQRQQIIAEHQAAEKAAASIKRYVRNMSGAPFRMKLDRHAPGQRGIQLKPRGERGDIAPIEPDDLNDPILQDNMNLGLLEIITSAEASSAMGKQSTNQQNVHPALAALKNQDGKNEGEMKLVVDKSMEEQGITVAELEDGQIAFERGKRGAEIKRPTRQPGESPGVPANIPGAEPGHSPANEQASFLSDLRSKTTVNPPQRS